MRRPLAAALALLVLAACEAEPATALPEEVVAGVDEAAARARREACEFRAGALPAATLATNAPHGAAIPIEHIVLVMQENRSFDHYFSELEGADGAAPDATLPAGDGTPTARYHEERLCQHDVPHGWSAVHRQWNDGAMDGFVQVAEPGGARAVAYYTESDLPYYYGLARAFAISDRHFSSLLGPTLPNRMFYFAGTSFGITENGIPPMTDEAGTPHPNLFTRLSDAGVTWKVYSRGVASPAMFLQTFSDHQELFVHTDRFFEDAASGALPAVSVVESRLAHEFGAGDDEHAPADVQVGQAFVASVVRAVTGSPAWPHAVLFVTYDEHGGFHDHVPPPPACPPDDLPVKLGPDDVQAAFDRLGVRVPLFAISPYAKRGHVSHVVSDLSSVARFVEARFDLRAMTARDANADPLFDLFDFSAPDLTVPTLPEPVIDQAELARCVAEFPEE